MTTKNTGKSLKKHNYFGFTLVELIVVITILAILGTIAFVSFTGYSGSARDSNRIADVANITKWLELAFIKTNTYPVPDNNFSVTYSGAVAWRQGTIGDTVMSYMGVGGSKLSKKPVDPLRNTEYSYSVAAETREYQIVTNYEGDSLSYKAENVIDGAGENLDPMILNPLFEQVSAASGNPTITYVKGNFNGLAVKVSTGTTIKTVYLLAIPSIVTSTGTVNTTFDVSSAANKLYLNGETNSGGISYDTNPATNPKLVVFSGTALPATDVEKAAFASGVAVAYSGNTTLATKPQITAFITALASGNSAALTTLGGGVVSASLGGGASGGSSGGWTTTTNYNCATPAPSGGNYSTTTPGTPTSTNQAWAYSATPGNCTYVCTGGYSGSGCLALAYSSLTTYTAGQQFMYSGAIVTVTSTGIGSSSTKADSNCDTNDIVVWQGGTNNIQIWAACNVGATISTGSLAVQTPNPTTNGTLPSNRVASIQGNYYQWGRNDDITSGAFTGSQFGGTFTNNSTNDTNFYAADGTYGDWNTSWVGSSVPSGGWNIATGGNSQWPCSSGYHVPTGGSANNTTQWGMAYAIINSATTFGSCTQATTPERLMCALNLPYAGYRNRTNGQYQNQGVSGSYWSSSATSTNAYNAYFISGGNSIALGNYRANGFSVRCIRN